MKGQGKLVISRVITRVTPLRAPITLPITYLLSPLPLQVGFTVSGLGGPRAREHAHVGFGV